MFPSLDQAALITAGPGVRPHEELHYLWQVNLTRVLLGVPARGSPYFSKLEKVPCKVLQNLTNT